MEADSPPTVTHSNTDDLPDVNNSQDENCDEANLTIHSFNISNVTVVEKHPETLEIDKKPVCEGSDSGVEVIEIVEYQRALSANSGNSQDFDNLNCARSCDSSIISYCSNYEDAYNILARKNSTLLEDYTLHNGDVTSENGSESSSISGSQSRAATRRINVNIAKKKIAISDSKTKSASAKDRARFKPPAATPAKNSSTRLKSTDRVQGKSPPICTKSNSLSSRKPTPTNLDLAKKNFHKRPSSAHNSTYVSPNNIVANRTPQTTPTDDGRWPSVNSKPAPLMSRSLKGCIEQKPKLSQMESKTIEKYATLPRRRKEKSADDVKVQKKSTSRENSMHRLVVTKKSSRETTPSKMSSSLYLPKPKPKTKIYHEICIQTALTMADVEKAFSGVNVSPKAPADSEKCNKDIQVDMRHKDLEKLKEQLKQLTEKYDALCNEHKSQTEKLKETEDRLKGEKLEKEGLIVELSNNSQRVLAILGGDNGECGGNEANTSSDSLMVLETRFQNVGQVVIQQEAEISRINSHCRSLQIDLEKSLAAQKTLLQHQQELEAESLELQEFMQAEKTTLTDALKEVETELKKQQLIITQKDKELAEKQEECKHLVRLSEQRRQENLGLQARLSALEVKSRELLVHQGSSVSGAAVALSALIERLNGLVEELIIAYNISEQELEDVIFHNEAYNNSSSSPESTPEKGRLFMDQNPSPKGKGSSFVSAVINAIKNAAAQTPFAGHEVSKENLCSVNNSSSNEMLDSETEPCLMMEHVLEDVVIPDGHSHNMISSGHGSMLSSRLTHSESLKDLSQAILNRQISEQNSLSFAGSLSTSFASEVISLSDLFPSISLVDQVIDVDNSITRLLKVIRIIQLENEDCMNELEDQRDNLSEQIDKQKDTNKVVVKQLKDWEILGARLKSEVKELMNQLSRKNAELDKVKSDLNSQREQVEKLNQDVCELSTALSKAEMEMKVKEEEVTDEIKVWEKTGHTPTPEILGRLVVSRNEVPVLKEKLVERERRLNELTQEFLASRQVLSESLKEAVSEAKKQYDAIDNALEVLHTIQSVVKQCPPLSKLQRDLEDVSFQSASAMPIVSPADFNANAALLQAVANLEIAPTINTTA